MPLSELQALHQARAEAEMARVEAQLARAQAQKARRLAPRDKNLSVAAHLVYALYALPIGSVLLGAIVAHVFYLRSEGSFVHSHFRWQVSTFWTALLTYLVLLGLVQFLVYALNAVGGLGLVAATMGSVGLLFMVLVWTIYRVAKGWYALFKGEKI